MSAAERLDRENGMKRTIDGTTEMRRLLILAAVVEGVAGLTLLLAPTIAIALLLQPESHDAAQMIARVAGVALLSLGVACTGAARDVASIARSWTITAITIYNGGVGLLLVVFAVSGTALGPLVWFAGLFHVGLALAFRSVPARREQAENGMARLEDLSQHQH
jgi:hypothetical protein